MNTIRDHIKGEVFDYTYLMSCLAEYNSPRSKITHLLKSGDIIRVKKGIYVFGQRHRRSVISLESVANHLYGPSYVSLEYALAFYGLIPEFVAEVTSVTTKRHKMFETPIGRFSYTPIPVSLFTTGFTILQVSDYESALIATKEKALADLFYIRKTKINRETELEELLFEDLRLDESLLRKFHIGILQDILYTGGNSTLSILLGWLRRNK
jgi:predicted transcriptional regulator of viral defense system